MKCSDSHYTSFITHNNYLLSNYFHQKIPTLQENLSVILAILGTFFIITKGNPHSESLKYIQPTETSILSSVEPLSAAFLSVIWLHVHFSVFQWLGTLCIIVAIIILFAVKNKDLVYE
ncbi:EamA family transporter [Clostridium kluyveri]|uniref:EamA domain-containing protein n=2 Tax=Clostridium kluyveri TaxID=1534 RepID=A5MYU3_CLOK5|nr:Conserved hypothetical protein [Clostridium kluyveri DSM 555]BAH06823.1 hypothetical protein CKR_1772 [Clostridium kluyveri NBRC 12016]